MKNQNTITLKSTKRLILRAMQIDDARKVYEYRRQPEVMQFQGWTPETIDEVAQYAKQMQTREVAAHGHWYQVVLENNQQVVGDVAFCIDTDTGQQAELGIALDLKYQKQGFATEAILGLVDYLFANHSLHRIHVSIDPDNLASRQLFTRCGFRFEGHHIQSVWFKGQWTDDVIMAILRQEWLEKNEAKK